MSAPEVASPEAWALEVARDGEVLVRYRLRGGLATVVGAGPTVDVRLVDDPSVSARQAFLRRIPEGFLLELLDFGRVGTAGAPEWRRPGDCVALRPQVPIQVGQRHVVTLRPVAKSRTASLDRAEACAPEAVQLRHAGGELRLPYDRAVTIGRHPKNDVVLDDARVSAHHAEIYQHDGAWWVRDLGSTNGTELEGLQVLEQSLPVDSVVTFGGVPVRFEGVLEDAQLRMLLGDTAAARHFMADIRRMAMSSAPVTVVGRSGPLRSAVARALHHASPRRDGPLVVVACANLVEGLSELFGHVKGAFTGAREGRKGLFESAEGGTLVLEGLEHLAESHQAALLRALETGTVRPAGANEERRVDVRVVATRTARALLREDLRHRLEVLVSRVPRGS